MKTFSDRLFGAYLAYLWWTCLIGGLLIAVLGIVAGAWLQVGIGVIAAICGLVCVRAARQRTGND